MQVLQNFLIWFIVNLFSLDQSIEAVKNSDHIDDIIVENNEHLIGIREIHNLANYVDYSDVSLMFYVIPKESEFVQLAVKVYSKTRSLIFSCGVQNITIHFKHSSIPIVSPDGTKFPSSFADVERSNLFTIQLLNDNEYRFIELAQPQTGYLFAVAYINWINPWKYHISQSGLHAECQTHMLAYAKTKSVFDIIELVPKTVIFKPTKNFTKLFKFQSRSNQTSITVNHSLNDSTYDHAFLCFYLGYNNTIPTSDYYYQKFVVSSKNLSFSVLGMNNFFVLVTYNLKETQSQTFERLHNEQQNCSLLIKPLNNSLEWNNVMINLLTETSSHHDFENLSNNNTFSYDYFNLALYMTDLPISYSYLYNSANLSHLNQPQLLNLTKEFTVFKFSVAFEQVGTTLLINVSLSKGLALKTNEDANKNISIIGCLNFDSLALPLKMGKCLVQSSLKGFSLHNLTMSTANNNNTSMLPFPEIGNWYLTLRVVDDRNSSLDISNINSRVNTTNRTISNDNLSCKNICSDDLEKCIQYCQLINNLSYCEKLCDKFIRNTEVCLNCTFGTFSTNTLGKQFQPNKTSIYFSITTTGCVKRDCNGHGYCNRHFTEIGTLMFTCMCKNQWIGWDCSDDRFVQKNYMVLIGSLLLVISNLGFIASIYVASKRRYYAEAFVYLCLMFFSMFYHACDSGEDEYRFCLLNSPDVLQFCDFYCGMLSFWMTMIIIADVDQQAQFRSICHAFGVILIAFLTEYNKHSLITFLLPFTIALALIFINWFTKFRRTNHLFPPRAYLRNFLIGSLLVMLALALFSFFETQENYQYIHSAWHVLIAVAICFLLPKPHAFNCENNKVNHSIAVD